MTRDFRGDPDFFRRGSIAKLVNVQSGQLELARLQQLIELSQ